MVDQKKIRVLLLFNPQGREAQGLKLFILGVGGGELMSNKVGRTIGEVNVDCTLRERHGHISRKMTSRTSEHLFRQHPLRAAKIVERIINQQ